MQAEFAQRQGTTVHQGVLDFKGKFDSDKVVNAG
jgi:hypothetical protein